MDELGEITESESPYCYVGSNPVQRIDPDGRTWGDIINGVGTAIADNAYPGMNTAGSYPAASVSDFNAGQKTGQVASLFIGATEAVFGGGMMGGGGLSAILSGGSSAPVSVPLIAGGAIVAGQGVTMMSKATSNLMTGNGQKQEKTTTDGGEKKANPKPANQTSSGTPTDKNGNKLGPSGKTQVNVVKHSSQKAAKDAARNEGKKAPVKHTNPQKGGDHYHPTDNKGNKQNSSTHHEY